MAYRTEDDATVMVTQWVQSSAGSDSRVVVCGEIKKGVFDDAGSCKVGERGKREGQELPYSFLGKSLGALGPKRSGPDSYGPGCLQMVAVATAASAEELCDGIPVLSPDRTLQC